MPPVTQKLIAAIVGVLLLVGGTGFMIYSQMEENAGIVAEIDGINNEIQGHDAVIATRESKKQLRDAQDQVFKQLVEILPQYSERQEEKIFEAVTQYSSIARLQFKGIIADPGKGGTTQPSGGPKPGAATPADFTRTQLTVRLQGTYFNFLKFLNRVENHESFLRVDEVSLSPLAQQSADASPDQKELAITVRISTFAYVTK
jgi:Tfp pilus assembly protein PilO